MTNNTTPELKPCIKHGHIDCDECAHVEEVMKRKKPTAREVFSEEEEKKIRAVLEERRKVSNGARSLAFNALDGVYGNGSEGCEELAVAIDVLIDRALISQASARSASQGQAVTKAIERCAQVGYQTCAETRHVTLGWKVQESILALSTQEQEIVVDHETPSDDTQDALCSTDDRQATPQDAAGDLMKEMLSLIEASQKAAVFDGDPSDETCILSHLRLYEMKRLELADFVGSRWPAILTALRSQSGLVEALHYIEEVCEDDHCVRKAREALSSIQESRNVEG